MPNEVRQDPRYGVNEGVLPAPGIVKGGLGQS